MRSMAVHPAAIRFKTIIDQDVGAGIRARPAAMSATRESHVRGLKRNPTRPIDNDPMPIAALTAAITILYHDPFITSSG